MRFRAACLALALLPAAARGGTGLAPPHERQGAIEAAAAGRAAEACAGAEGRDAAALDVLETTAGQETRVALAQREASHIEATLAFFRFF